MVIFGPRILNSNDETMDSQLVLATPILAVSTATAPDFYTYQAEEVSSISRRRDYYSRG
jgi:hypothetical protein